MSNSLLHKKRALVVAAQPTPGTPNDFSNPADYGTLPVEDLTFGMDRGSLNISRSGVTFGGPGSLRPKLGSHGWSISATAEVQDTPGNVPQAILLLLACGFRGATDNGDFLFYPSDACLLGDPQQFQAGCFTVAEVQDCAITKVAQDVTGTATITLSAGERAVVAYSLQGRVLDDDTVIDTTDTERDLVNPSPWALPYTVVGCTAEINGVAPVNLQSVEIDIGMDVSDMGDALAKGGLAIVKPELTEYITVSFNVAQDSVNRLDFWQRFFDDDKMTLEIELEGPNGGKVKFTFMNLRADAPADEDVNGRRHYGMSAVAFVDEALIQDKDRDAAMRALMLVRVTPAPTSSPSP
jgi:hypothetical protein